jgi:hypothetical protein
MITAYVRKCLAFHLSSKSAFRIISQLQVSAPDGCTQFQNGKRNCKIYDANFNVLNDAINFGFIFSTSCFQVYSV